MSSRYAQQAATAVKMIGAKGRAVTFTRKASGTFDPIAQTTTGSPTTITMKAVGFAPGKSAEFRIGTLVGRNLIELHCAPALGPVPDKGDTVEFQGHTWSVIWVEELNPDGAGAIYAKTYLER